jgi:hypothetical protein
MRRHHTWWSEMSIVAVEVADDSMRVRCVEVYPSTAGSRQIRRGGSNKHGQNLSCPHCPNPMLIHDRIVYSHIDEYVPTLPDTSRSIRLSSPRQQNISVSFKYHMDREYFPI